MSKDTMGNERTAEQTATLILNLKRATLVANDHMTAAAIEDAIWGLQHPALVATTTRAWDCGGRR